MEIALDYEERIDFVFGDILFHHSCADPDEWLGGSFPV
jgi:hypothetical protein